MPVNSRHPDYTKALPAWVRCRDFIAAGRDGVKAKKKEYLPKPEGLDELDYDQGYLVRAPFFAASTQTARAMAGTLIRKPPTVTGERFKREFEANIDLAGTDLQTFIAHACDEMVQPSRFGVLVDRPSPSIETDLQGNKILVPPPRLVDRPYTAFYDAESIINWGHGIDAYGVPFLAFVVLEEPITLPGADRFKPTMGLQWRVLMLDESGHYRVEVYRLKPGVLLSAAGADDFVLFSESMPAIGAEPWTEIPFEIFGPRDRHWEIDEPLLLPVVNVNWDHYMRAADYVHSLHFTACPMAWAAAAGLGPDALGADGKPLVISWGSSRMLLLPEGGQVGVAEVSGKGAEANLAALEAYQRQMAHLGAQMLTPEKRAAEAAETLEIRSLGQTASLATASRTMGAGFTRIAHLMLQWQGASPQQIADTAVTMNTDFASAALSAQDLTAIVGAHQLGEITDEDLFWNLERGERIKPGQTFEDWNRDRLEQARTAPGDGGELDEDEDEERRAVA